MQKDIETSREDEQKAEEIRTAMVTISQMKKRGKESRSPSEEKKFNSALQLVAKNQELIKKMNIAN